MNDKYYLFDILASEKNMTVNMAISLNEASCDNIYKKYFAMFKDVSKTAKDLYYFAYNNNWYQLENAESTKISEEINKLEDELENSNS